MNRRVIKSIWNGQFGGLRTVSKIQEGENKVLRLLNRKSRSFAQRPNVPVRPDMEWGKEAEARAMVWLREQGLKPVNESHLNKGWDICCGEDKFEVKGRKSYRTAVRLTENEWKAAKQLKERYTVLILTARNKQDLKKAEPQEIVDPTSNPESWKEKERVVYEYFFVE